MFLISHVHRASLSILSCAIPTESTSFHCHRIQLKKIVHAEIRFESMTVKIHYIGEDLRSFVRDTRVVLMYVQLASIIIISLSFFLYIYDTRLQKVATLRQACKAYDYSWIY